MRKSYTLIAVLTLAIGFFGGLFASSRTAMMAPDAAPPVMEAAQTPAPLPARAALPSSGVLPDLSSVAEAALNSAANISSTNTIRRRNPWAYWFDDVPQYQTSQSQSLGSGVVVSPDGLVLTNTHVIGSAGADVRVTLRDGRERPGKIIGIDDLSDLAVVKVDARNLPTLPWGDSSKLRVAEWVLAIGNPYQLSGTVTLGIVSTVSRSGGGGVTDFIQTDAAINPGNSGGALVNARGELVGINSMIYSDTGGYQGIGFAIPSRLAQRIMTDLVSRGSVSWGSIGYVQWIDPVEARRYGFGDTAGPLVVRIAQTSAAYRGGLRPNDVLLSVDGKKTADTDSLSRAIAEAKVGSQVKVEVEREGRRLTLTLPVESRAEQQPINRRR